MNKELTEREKFGLSIVEAVSKGTTFSGLLPREVAAEIQMRKELLAEVRGLCTVHHTTGEYTVYVEGDGANVAYVAEAGTIGETTPSIKPIALAALKLGAIVRVSREFVNDLGVSVMDYLVEVLAKAFARWEDNEILFGAGTSGNRGVIRGVATNVEASNVVTAASATTVTWEEVKSVIQRLKAYRKSATFLCGQPFLDIVHHFKDGNGYIFNQQRPITEIMGIPVRVCKEFPTLGAGEVGAIVGDFSYYHLLEREGEEVTTLRELYAANDQTGIRVLERIDGDLFPEAFAVLKMGGSSSGGGTVTVPAPAISVSDNTVTITASGADSIYYTIDGSTPTSSNGTRYSAPFAISATVTVKAIAYIGSTASSVTTQTAEYVASGTADDPITYVAGVTALVYGKFYTEGGVTYFCCIDHPASASSLSALGNTIASAYSGGNMWLGVGYMGANVAFDNPSGLTLTSSDGKNFVVTGSLNKMTASQAEAFGWPDYPDSQYISLYIKGLGPDNPVVIQGWVSDKDSTDYQTQKSGSTDPGKILAVTQGEALRTDTNNCFVWKCELTDGSVYTVDLTAQAAAVGA